MNKSSQILNKDNVFGPTVTHQPLVQSGEHFYSAGSSVGSYSPWPLKHFGAEKVHKHPVSSLFPKCTGSLLFHARTVFEARRWLVQNQLRLR